MGENAKVLSCVMLDKEKNIVSVEVESPHVYLSDVV